MNELRLTLPETTGVVIERQTIDRLVKQGNADCALLYLYLRAADGMPTVYTAAEALSKPPAWVTDTAKRLVDMGLLQSEPTGRQSAQTPPFVQEMEVPAYTAEEISKELESQSPFPSLVQDVQQRVGRILTTTDLKILFGLYDYLDLPPEVISILITHCLEEAKRQEGGGGEKRPLRMRSVERQAYLWKRMGVETVERAEVFLKEMERRRSVYGELMEVLQLPARAPAPTEQKYLDSWVEMGFSIEAVALAYDKTVLKTGGLKWAYLNSILKQWHEKNLHTLGEISAGDGKKAARGQGLSMPGKGNPQSEQDAIEWMRQLVEKQGQESL